MQVRDLIEELQRFNSMSQVNVEATIARTFDCSIVHEGLEIERVEKNAADTVAWHVS